MTISERHNRPEAERDHSRLAWLVFTTAVLLIPVWFFLGGFVSRPDARSMADGPEGFWYWPLTLIVLVFSFGGCVCAPFLTSQKLGSQTTLAALAIIVFLADVCFAMFAVIMVFGFVD
jgi:hypothetical protein